MKHLKHIFENSGNNYDYEELYNRLKKLSDVIKSNIHKTFSKFGLSPFYFYNGFVSTEDLVNWNTNDSYVQFILDHNLPSTSYDNIKGQKRCIKDMEKYNIDTLDKISIIHSVYYITPKVWKGDDFREDVNINKNNIELEHRLDIWLDKVKNNELTELINELGKRYRIRYISYRKSDGGFIIALRYDLKELNKNITKLYKNL
tara:strand:+ start:2150 stop:2755 length:606 start_codon:yes stop_codon:yes gene_type:complete